MAHHNGVRYLTAALLGIPLALSAADGTTNHAGMTYDQRFERIATFPNYRGHTDPSKETVSEIIAATPDGGTVLQTDSERELVRTISIKDPTKPRHLGAVEVDGEPTSVAVRSAETAVVSVDTSDGFTNPSGELVMLDITEPAKPRVRKRLDLGGQPDAVAIGPNGRYTAVAVENERDEEICVGGELHGGDVPEDDTQAIKACRQAGGTPGGLPQTSLGNPPGHLAIYDHRRERMARVELTGLAGYAPGDPEPEFVTINEAGEAVVTLQENNHMAVVDVAAAKVIGDFPAGRVSLSGVDATTNGRIELNDRLRNTPREPDSVTWLEGVGSGASLLATANEGDLRGGSRGFSLFNADGEIVFDNGNAFEHLAVRHGHFPEKRAGAKGTEPEGIGYSAYGDNEYLFVASERGGFIAVYELWGTKPRFVQLLPGPLEPEHVLPLPERDLLVISGEEDAPPLGVRSTTMVYRLDDGAPSYPQLVSANDGNGRPLPWSSLSGMAGLRDGGGTVLAVEDSFFEPGQIVTIDSSERPAVVTNREPVGKGQRDLDLEGIAPAPDGTRWLTSEGGQPDGIPNELIQISPDGSVEATAKLPPSIRHCREASNRTTNLDNGFEGLAIQPHSDGYRVLVAQQLPWTYTSDRCSDRDDARGMTRLWRYNPANQRWDSIAYELQATPENASWVGLSEIRRAPDGAYLLIERDNRTGAYAAVKHLVRVPASALRDGRIKAGETKRVDLIPHMETTEGWISDKPEGLAIDAEGTVYLSNDNDGLDEWTGETLFQRLGAYAELFPRAE
jgi:hypothetical protein